MQQLDMFIQIAENEADAYIGTHYTLPLKKVPPVLVPYVCDLARYRIYGEKATERIKALHDDAIYFLKQIASGKSLLGVVNQDSAMATLLILPQRNANSQVFRADDWGDFNNNDTQQY